MIKDIIVSTTPQETRVALLEDGVLAELFIERQAQRNVVGNVYKGRVTRVLPGMQSAFLDIGLERDAFLYVADALEGLDQNLLTDEEKEDAPRSERNKSLSIEEKLKEGQEIVVQVLKEPLGTKGARITSHVSLPGRYLVYMPTVEHIGVSRKISDDDERRRLKTILKQIRHDSGGGGFIARTAGGSKSVEDFERDARYLVKAWDEVRAVASRTPAPAVLHTELALVQRLLRDILNQNMGAIHLDDAKEHQKTADLVAQLQPEMLSRVRLHTRKESIFEEHGVAAEIEKALRSKVWLQSGGYIVINQTEALVAIDVNTGRNVGSRKLEDTVLQTNIDAATELVRQIRLRDLGGIIVVDFIDMEERKNRKKVMAILEQELRKDRSPTKILSINEFGLAIVTRKRVKESLEHMLCEPCPYCDGRGAVKSVATVAHEIHDEIHKLSDDLRGQPLVLRVNPAVARGFAADHASVWRSLESLVGGRVKIQGDPLLHQEQFDLVTHE